MKTRLTMSARRVLLALGLAWTANTFHVTQPPLPRGRWHAAPVAARVASDLGVAEAPAPADEPVAPASPGGAVRPSPAEPVSRTLRLRDSIWARQALDDLVAAEFALRLELSGESNDAASFVDFERLREQLDNRIDELDSGAGSSKIARSDLAALRSRARDTAAALSAAAANSAARAALHLPETAPDDDVDEAAEVDEVEKYRRFWADFRVEFVRRRDAVGELGWYALRGPPKDVAGKNMSAVLYVRQDGSVDWEGALQGAKAATAFSVDLWKRINGVGDDAAEASSAAAPDGARPPLVAESSKDRRERSLLAVAAGAVAATKALVAAREAVDAVVADKGPTSAVGDSVRAAFRVADKQLKVREGDYVAARLELQLERACAALEAALDASTASVDISDRRFVAEFALLDAQLTALSRDAGAVGVAILRPEFEMLGKEIRDFSGRLGVDRFDALSAFYDALVASGEFVDADLLLIFDENQLGRLGTKADGAGESMPTSSLGLLLRNKATGTGPLASSANYLLSSSAALVDNLSQALAAIRVQIRRGFAFYADGSRLLANDVAFCWTLIGRAFSGETLVPRDVRVLRRTLKDLSTTIPFVVILLIPLTPVGHVFVFGAIQRFFPDFFPSCYTERRQNLVKLYASAELDRLPERKKPGADKIFKL